MAPAWLASCGPPTSRSWRSTDPTAKLEGAPADQIPPTRSKRDALLAELVTATAPRLLELHGVGLDTAAALLVAAGDNPERLRSEAAWAHLCGAAPVPASSGKVTRYRLNRGGDRQANAALYVIVITRMKSDPRTRAYVARRTSPQRRQGQGRHNPHPQALRRTRGLSPPPSPLDRGATSGDDLAPNRLT